MNKLFNDNVKSSLKENECPFELPENWSWFKWGDLIKSYEQGMIRSNLDLVSKEEGTFYFKMHNISSEGFSNYIKKEYTIATEEELKKYALNDGDFVINVRNSYELVGKTCIINNIEKNSTYNHMIIKVVHIMKELNYYINALFSKTSWSKYIDGCKKGTTTVIALYKDDLMNIPIPIPDKDTFELIVNLEKNINSKISNNNIISNELDSISNSIYSYWFNQFNFPDKSNKPFYSNNGDMILCEKINKKIPLGWNLKKLSDLFYFEKGKMPNELFNTDNKQELKKYLTIEVVNGGIPQYCKTDSMKLCNGETLMVMDGASSGDVYIGFEGVIGSTLSKIVSKDKKYSDAFIYRILQNHKELYKRANTGSTVPHTNKNYIENIEISLPDDVSEFSRIFETIQKIIINNENENFNLLRFRDFIIPFLISHRIKK